MFVGWRVVTTGDGPLFGTNDRDARESEKKRKQTKRTWNELHAPPNAERQDAVMNDMQSRNVRLLFAQHEESGIDEFDEFDQKVEVRRFQHHLRLIRVRVVDRLTAKRVVVKPGVFAEHIDDGGTDKHHEKIVGDHRQSHVERCSIAHQSRSDHFDRQHVTGADSDGGQWARHERQMRHSWISLRHKPLVRVGDGVHHFHGGSIVREDFEEKGRSRRVKEGVNTQGQRVKQGGGRSMMDLCERFW